MTTPRFDEMLKVLKFAFHMSPKNTKNRLPTSLFSRQSLRAEGSDLLEAVLLTVWRDGRGESVKSSGELAPCAPVTKAIESEFERAGRILLDPAISTTKALILLQAERSRREIEG